MKARTKLNISHFNGSVALAALAGWLAQSWIVFALAMVALLAGNLYFNEIRLGRHGRPGPDGR